MRKLLNMVHSFMTDVDRVELELSWIRKLWYVIVLIVTSIYVLCNFPELVDFTFFDQFNGKNLIFILWLLLILIPLFDNFEGFGIRFNTHKMIESNKISSQLADDVLKRGPKGYDELTKEWETSQKEKKDE